MPSGVVYISSQHVNSAGHSIGLSKPKQFGTYSNLQPQEVSWCWGCESKAYIWGQPAANCPIKTGGCTTRSSIQLRTRHALRRQSTIVWTHCTSWWVRWSIRDIDSGDAYCVTVWFGLCNESHRCQRPPRSTKSCIVKRSEVLLRWSSHRCHGLPSTQLTHGYDKIEGIFKLGIATIWWLRRDKHGTRGELCPWQAEALSKTSCGLSSYSRKHESNLNYWIWAVNC